jgi:type 1 glutamine amidotransferase
MKGKHPAAWCHMIDKGRSLYTVGGHTNESFAEPLFMKHLHGAIWWACGNNNAPPSLPADTDGTAEKKPSARTSAGDSR